MDFDNDLNNDGSLKIEIGAVLSFTGTVGGSRLIDFNGSNGTLVIGVPSVMTNTITNFAPTDGSISSGSDWPPHIAIAAAYYAC